MQGKHVLYPFGDVHIVEEEMMKNLRNTLRPRKPKEKNMVTVRFALSCYCCVEARLCLRGDSSR